MGRDGWQNGRSPVRSRRQIIKIAVNGQPVVGKEGVATRVELAGQPNPLLDLIKGAVVGADAGEDETAVARRLKIGHQRLPFAKIIIAVVRALVLATGVNHRRNRMDSAIGQPRFGILMKQHVPLLRKAGPAPRRVERVQRPHRRRQPQIIPQRHHFVIKTGHQLVDLRPLPTGVIRLRKAVPSKGGFAHRVARRPFRPVPNVVQMQSVDIVPLHKVGGYGDQMVVKKGGGRGGPQIRITDQRAVLVPLQPVWKAIGAAVGLPEPMVEWRWGDRLARHRLASFGDWIDVEIGVNLDPFGVGAGEQVG